jgi:pyruvate/2-oxoglutarate dehydrogenase complex dihydrolipoamide acyltransferase (E2) component
VRRVLPLAVAADHRVLDGADLGAFVATLARLVTQPLLLLGEEG